MAVPRDLSKRNAGVGGDRSRQPLGSFPKEFERSFWESLDKRFAAILLVTLLLDVAMITFFAVSPPPREVSRDEIRRIQKQFARLIEPSKEAEKLRKTVAVKRVAEEAPGPVAEARPEATARARRRAAAVETAEERSAERAEAAAGRRRTRSQISSAVAGTGILGLLTSTSLSAVGAGVEDVLGNRAMAANLDEALANVSRIKRGSGEESSRGAGSGDGDLRGGRASTGGSIDALVEGLGQGVAKGVKRSGNLVISEAEPVIENENGRSGTGRNQDDIAAVIMQHNSVIQYCYQKELRRDPNLKGKLVLRLVITPQGTVDRVSILSSTLNNPRVEACVVERIERWNNFGAADPTQGNTTVRQVYSFGY